MVSFAPVDARDLLGVSRDMSSGGIRFEAVGCEIELGEVLRMTFSVGDQTVVAIGRVAWSTEIDPLTLDVGLEFVEIDPEAVEHARRSDDARSRLTARILRIRLRRRDLLGPVWPVRIRAFVLAPERE